MKMPRRPMTILLAASILAGCTVGPTPPERTPPRASPTVALTPTAALIVGRVAPGVPTRGVATPDLPQRTARDGAALIVQAVSLLLAESVRPESPAIVYGAAYDGAVAALRRLGYTVAGDAPQFGDDPGAAERFTTAYLRLATAPIIDVNQTGLAQEVIRAAAARLHECNTAFLTPREFAATRDDGASTTYGGLGLTLRPGNGPPTIATVYPDTPAARLGLLPGDTITAIDNVATATLTPTQASAALRGPLGTTLTLTLGRSGEPGSRVVVLTREAIRPPLLTASTLLDSGGRMIGLLRFTSLAAGVERELDAALARFAEVGVAGLILDLREVAGEEPLTLTAIAGRFLAGGQPVAYRLRGDRQETLVAPAGPETVQLPLAVLLNGGTVGTAELLAAALADNGRARLFGEPTGGCVSLGTVFPLADGAALRIGTARLNPPSRRDLTDNGQQPDERIWSRPTAASDPPRDAALSWLASKRSERVGQRVSGPVSK
jgi:carboxyl-terminal processing protease